MIQVSANTIAAIIAIGGILSLAGGLFLGITALVPRALIAGGLAVFALSLAVPSLGTGRAPSPLPGPTPNPTPFPGPTPSPLPTPGGPLTPLGAGVAQSFTADGGTKADAQVLGALHRRMGDGIAIDGLRPQQTLKTTNDLGRYWNEAQAIRGVPLAGRYPNTEKYLVAGIRQYGLAEPAPLDPPKRNTAAQFFREVGGAFTTWASN